MKVETKFQVIFNNNGKIRTTIIVLKPKVFY